MKLATTLEAILYIKAQPLSLEELADTAGQPRHLVADALLELMDDYAHRDSALEVVETPTGFSLQLRESFQALVTNLIPTELSIGAQRTLAAIALKSPILQTELIELRGSGAYQHIQDLLAQGFIKRRRQQEGRSYWLEVSAKFHQYFEFDAEDLGLSPNLPETP
ncbi:MULTISPECIES: SMC-Scp complex subunit ScpB [Cyanophyceae]|uniref:SMC-Scp complex subunit ScpB n=1 Tax=Cyanophyceae TaxID=3028117 RepID=UPI00016DCD1E|nr:MULTISPECIES: SMC-Scp complex subunit ScpB [Cyanophyceae]ACB00451.1 segregation and condensation protein B [Picosynechococcus sp. PCC 7002]AMA10039.1 segregation and condensation protein B [Picosynechococcus sp. PCC 73109]QCS48302.1 SMC-Scp complex subunit ScpB [Picosynechococcus sp. PCC 11901]SMH49495.1 condensin subunit ScpB [Picosynechococcus sp. OG1]SMQ81587.1 condensin subunit ScpB [Synechococcus sp. 7002]